MYYEVAYEISKRFMSDLIKATHLNIFEQLFMQFQNDFSRYEAKIAIMLNLYPMMNLRNATHFMKIIEEVIQNKPNESIFMKNINPMRVGLMLYRLVDQV